MSRDFKEQVRATFKGVKREDFEQKVKEFNGLKRKNTNPFSIALGTANFEAYKAEYLKKIKSPYSNKKAVIKSFRNRTRKHLEKREDIYNEILLGNEITIFLADPFDLYRYYTKKHEVIELMKFEEYLNEQENIKTLSPKQPESNKPDEVKKELHSHIFKDNAFEIWEAMYNAFQITKRSRTDLRFMYEIMKYNKEIHDTVTVTNITNWINEVYDFGLDKLHYTNINDNSNRMRRNTYDLIKQRA